MKKYIAVICAILAFPAVAEVRPVFEEEVIEETEEVLAEPEQQQVQQPAPVQKPVLLPIGRAAVQNVRGAAAGRQSVSPQSRAVASRAAVPQAVRTESRAVSVERPVSSRTAVRSATIQNRATNRTRAVARTIASGNAPAQTTRENASAGRTVQARAGTLYNAARVGTTSNVMASTRAVSARAGVNTVPKLFNASNTDATSSGTSTADAEELAATTDFCKAQYASCMDNFCNVLDDNQGRCTCSESITTYIAVESALKQATIDLQDVATKIRYLGLTKDEVATLFKETEAEYAMANSVDTSALKSTMDTIQNFLVDPTIAFDTENSGTISFNFGDLSLGEDFDLDSFLSSTDNKAVKNQRGAKLFETAQGNCKDILTTCKGQGVIESLITASYDLEIDKQCIAYERSLTDANDTMKATIRNAKNVLQQARLAVAQNKNRYDIKGCVSALDACMVDDFVCGSDYKNCLDHTGKYISNGSLIVGSEPNLDSGWYYGINQDICVNPSDTDSTTNCANAFNGGSVMAMVEKYFQTNGASSDAGSGHDPKNIINLLVNKIGGIENGRTVGMCASVLNQCQRYTYDENGYKKDNDVIKEYLNRTLIRIKAEQDEVLASYGESCRLDIMTCLRNSGGSNSGTTSPSGLYTAINSCRSYIKTCGAILNVGGFDGDVASLVCPTTCTVEDCPAKSYIDVEKLECVSTMPDRT